MGIIFVIVIGTLLATVVLFIHSRKTYNQPLTNYFQKFVLNRWVWAIILKPPVTLLELWTEYGLIHETRIDANDLDPIFLEKMGANRVGIFYYNYFVHKELFLSKFFRKKY